MTRIAAHAFVLLLCLGFAGPAPAVSDPAPAAPSTVPAGTPVVLALDERLDSENVQAGQRFALHVAEDVQVDGVVAIPKGAPATGTVLFARKRGNARSGALDLRVDAIDAPVGAVPVRASLSRRSRYLAAEHAADYALLGLGFSVRMEQGEAIVLEPGTLIDVEARGGGADRAAPAVLPAWMPALKPDQGLVIIFREKRFYGSANSIGVFADDGVALPKVRNGQWVHHYFTPGDHRLYRDRKRRDVRIVGVEPGSVQFFEARFEAKSTIGADVDLVPVEADDAVRRIGALHAAAR